MSWLRFWRRRRNQAGADTTRGGYQYRFFGGRRHLAGVPYALPKDDREINRLDFQHYMLRFALGGNFIAPITQPRDILDVGCGSGRWPLDMAMTFPRANVVGLDITPPPADAEGASAHRPANYVFVAGNILEGLPFADASFDLVHQRLLVGALPADRWLHVVQELARLTRPGGWVELVEGNIKLDRAGPALEQLGDWAYQGMARRGIDGAMCTRIGQLLEQAGLTRVTQRMIELPVGARHGRLGAMMETNHFALFEGLKGLIVATQITTAEAYDAAVQAARVEVARGNPVGNVYLATGQRVA